MAALLAVATSAGASGPPVLHLGHDHTLEVRGNRSIALDELQHAVASYKQDPPPSRNLAACRACTVCVIACIEPLPDAELAQTAVRELYLRVGFADVQTTLEGDVLAIEEGARHRLRSYRFYEVDAGGQEIEPLGGRGALDGVLHVRSGAWLSPYDVAGDVARVREYYGNAGYGRVEISPMPTSGTHQPDVDLLARIVRGPRLTIDSVRIVGNVKVSDAAIRRASAVAPGQVFSDAAIERTRRALEATGAFEIVEMSWRRVEGTADRAEVTIAVGERAR